MKGIFTNPVQTVGIIAIMSICGLIGIGAISFFTTSKSPESTSSIVKTLADIALGAAGAKAGLAQFKPPASGSDEPNK